MSNKSLAAIAIILILGGLNIIQFNFFTLPQLSGENTPFDVETVLDGDKEEHIGKTITLDGYYIEGGSNLFLLVTDPIVYEKNSLTPTNYLMIGGSIPLSLQGQQGAQVHLTGEISWADVEEGLLSIKYTKYKLIKEGVIGHLANKFFNLEHLKEELSFVPYVTTKYAVLISGGIKPEKAYARYWNDITGMYFILTWLHGYDPANMYVVYKNGIAEDNFAPVHGPATHTYIQAVFSELEEKMGRLDDLFIYTTNHGGTAGLSLWKALDPSVLTPNN